MLNYWIFCQMKWTKWQTKMSKSNLPLRRRRLWLWRRRQQRKIPMREKKFERKTKYNQKKKTFSFELLKLFNFFFVLFGSLLYSFFYLESLLSFSHVLHSLFICLFFSYQIDKNGNHFFPSFTLAINSRIFTLKSYLKLHQ